LKDTLIIIEGTDCNFKTTVAHLLSEELNYDIHKGSSFELASKGNKELYLHFRALAALEKGIIDRYIYSNIIYASKFKDYSIITNYQKEHLESLLLNKAVVVYLHADDETVKKRLRERGDEYIDVSHINELNKAYRDLMGKAELTVLSFDTSVYGSHDIAEQVIQWL